MGRIPCSCQPNGTPLARACPLTGQGGRYNENRQEKGRVDRSEAMEGRRSEREIGWVLKAVITLANFSNEKKRHGPKRSIPERENS